ncbi:beta-N-acetylhexosaminidase [Akkermansia glycaniphila]|uniref:beta-N-acetylhexosaminidase n=1 Tax=Akkermansia glycaniphila TaxID=1679444 RepID=UPI00248C60AA|nr:beta-N-acetylhexosaminidase [Akkermansia glycaniphila]MBT9449571.1 beta-N-acetylhexosaminidase [Akkermansia glycaniphila]
MTALTWAGSPASVDVPVIPRPVSAMAPSDGDPTSATTQLKTPRIFYSDDNLRESVLNLQRMLDEGTGSTVEVSKIDSMAKPKLGPNLTPVFVRMSTDDALKSKGEEAYELDIQPNKVTIEVNGPKGVFYAGQTLAQLLPSAFFNSSPEAKKSVRWTLPIVTITDYPRFPWRALLLDEARHFFGEKETKRIIDQMAALKMNVLHWHLTDDAGWRIEIKKYPKLTEIGSKRADSEIGTWGSGKREGKPHGGYYTQQQIRDIVKYAADRNITVVPEIGMPGHVSALVASYPEYGTDKKPIVVPEHFGKLPSALDASDPKVYEFLSDILDEVIPLFPGQVIHIGGDEVMFDQWKNSPAIKKLAQEQGFKNQDTDIQVYFTNKMSDIVDKKGRRMMGWNDILGHDLHGQGAAASTQKLASNAIVHFWKGSADLAKQAIEQGHDVINSTHSSTYLDYSYGSIPMSKAYAFEPIFSGLDQKYHKKVLGLGCQMWTEWVADTDKLHYQIFPRLCAFAEVGWTPSERKDYRSFKQRMQPQYERMDLAGIKYAKDVKEKVTHEDMFNAKKVADWTPESIKPGVCEWNVTPDVAAGNNNVTFVYSRGNNALRVKSLVLLENGTPVAEDRHVCHSGVEQKEIVYKLVLPAVKKDATYTLKAELEGVDGQNSYGSLYLEH